MTDPNAATAAETDPVAVPDIVNRLRHFDLPLTDSRYRHEVAGRAADEIEALRERVVRLETSGKVLVAYNDKHFNRATSEHKRAEAAEARVVELAGALRAAINILETLRKERLPERPKSQLAIFHDDRDRITQAVIKKATTALVNLDAPPAHQGV